MLMACWQKNSKSIRITKDAQDALCLLCGSLTVQSDQVAVAVKMLRFVLEEVKMNISMLWEKLPIDTNKKKGGIKPHGKS